MLRGKKVLLRPVRRADIQYFLKWFNDLEVIQYLNLYLPMTEMAEEKYIEELGASRAQNTAMFVIEAIEGDSSKPFDAAQGKPIGNTGLSNISARDHHATFGIAIGEKDYWSKGYGTEAARLLVNYGFEQLNLHRINSGLLLLTSGASGCTRGSALRKRGARGSGFLRTVSSMTMSSSVF